MATFLTFDTAKPITAVGTVATADNFGVNFLYNRDAVDTQNTTTPGEIGVLPKTFDDALRAFGPNGTPTQIATLRYPGGGIAEDFLDLSMAAFTATTQDGMQVTNPLKFLDFCKNVGADMSLVLPTKRFIDPHGSFGNRGEAVDVAEVRAYVTRMLEEAHDRGVQIEAIELGNEWWGGQVYWTAAEYGRVASKMALVVQQAIDDFRSDNAGHLRGWEEPKIAVQVGHDGDASAETAAILEQFSDAAFAAIDATLTHRYLTGGLDQVDMVEGPYLEQFNVWEELASQMGRDASHQERMVTEWNVCGDNVAESGLRSASALLGLFAEHLEYGVRHANIWAVQQNNFMKLTWDNGIPVGDRNNSGGFYQGLSSTGEMFRLMNESLRGTRVLDTRDAIGTDALKDTAVEAFAGNNRLVVFISDRTGDGQDVVFDAGQFQTGTTHVWGSILGVAEGENPIGRNPHVLVENLMADGLHYNNGKVSFTLDPWETIRLVFTQGDAGIVMDGQVLADKLVGGNGADSILGQAGDDLLSGGLGNDWLRGGLGHDKMVGGTGHDLMIGNGGADTLYGLAGNDTLRGSMGADALFGGDDSDVLNGQGGNDTLNGAEGNDLLIGGKGNDLLIGFHGNDTLYGGAGRDTVSFQLCADAATVDLAVKTAQVTGAGMDVMKGIENLILTAGADRVFGNGAGNEFVLGDGNDVAYGRNGHDTLLGENGNDLLDGGQGNDRLIGQAGVDTLTGGAGADRFCFKPGDAADVITDFHSGLDQIVIDADGRLDWNDLDFHMDADGLVLTYATYNSIHLHGLTMDDLLPRDMLFL